MSLPVLLPSHALLPHEFVFTGKADSVYVAGTFNGWSRFSHPLKKDSLGRWTGRIRVPIGRHQYKLVLNGSQWIEDPLASQSQDDGQGNTNSVLSVFPSDAGQPARRGDGRISSSLLAHEPSMPWTWVEDGKVHLELTHRTGDVEGAWLVAGSKKLAMPVAKRSQWTETRRASLPLASRLQYRFLLKDGKTQLSFGAGGSGSQKPFVVTGQQLRALSTPQWPKGAVIYQIFPDRFANGSRANDPSDVQPWGAKPTWFNWMGGDAVGVQQRIPYLKSLGIQAVYFNPVFAGPSNHRYDKTDFKAIDPRFGTDQEFSQLTLALEKAGIKTVMDGVFNHTSTDFFAFRDLLAQQDRSAYASWYTVRSYPVSREGQPTYEAWNGFGSMPKVNLSNPEARAFMLSIPQHWSAKARIHGWRLDVAGEVEMGFWREFRRRVKAGSPENWIVGEVWTDGSPWLGGDQWDSIMGYQFRDLALRFFARREATASETLKGLLSLFASYAPPVSHSLMNLLGSHDTPRLLHEMKGNREGAQAALALLLSWPGAPSLYYGDEILMDGGQDPDNRRGMDWSAAEKGTSSLSLVRKLISLRRTQPALKEGDPEWIGAWDDKEAFVFGRVKGSSRVLAAFNRSSQEQTVHFTLPPSWRKWSLQPLRDALGQARVTRLRSGEIRMSLAPLSGAVVVPR